MMLFSYQNNAQQPEARLIVSEGTASSTSHRSNASKHTAKPLCPRVEVSFCFHDENGARTIVFGKKLASFCLAVKSSGSLYAAAKDAGMSYSRAWKNVSLAEDSLGKNLFIRRGNKGTILSPLGEKLLDAYLYANEDMAKRAESLFSTLENNPISE